MREQFLGWTKHYVVQSFPHDFWSATLAVFGGVVSWLLPGEVLLKAFWVMFGATILDNVTAVLAAVNNPKDSVRSSEFSRTLVKLAIYFSAAFFARLVAEAFALIHIIPSIQVDTEMTSSFAVGFVLIHIIVRELWSNVENIHAAGYPLPPRLVKALEGYKRRLDGQEEGDGHHQSDPESGA